MDGAHMEAILFLREWLENRNKFLMVMGELRPVSKVGSYPVCTCRLSHKHL